MRGNLEITKTSEDKKVEGIRFKVTGKTESGTAYDEILKQIRTVKSLSKTC